MTQPIDTAYVDIVVRDKSLDRLQKDINKSLDKIEKDVQKDLDKIDRDFDDAFDQIDKHFADMTKTAEKNFDELTNIVEESTDAIDAQFDSTFKRSKKHFNDMGNDADGAFKRIRRRFQEPLEDALASIGNGVKMVGSLLGQLGSSVGGVVSSSPLLALIAVLTPAIIGLAGALTQLIGIVGIIPAGFGVLLSAIIPVVVAFQNFGDAVGALAEGDVEKINEALAKLSGSAQIFAREVAVTLPFLREFQRSLQESFFSTITGSFTKLISILPAIRGNLGAVTASMGRLAKSLIDVLASPSTIATLNSLFATTSRIITGLTGPFSRFTDMLFNTVGAGLPFVERLSAAFGKVLERFSAFVNTSITNGDFDQFVEDAITTVKELIGLVKSLGGLLGTLFAGTEDAGHGFIVSLTEMITRLDEFLQTADGQTVIDGLVFGIKALAASLSTALGVIIFFIQTFKMMMRFFELVGQGAVSLVDTLDEWFTKAHDVIVETIGRIPEIIGEAFQAAIDAALFALGVGIGIILFVFTELPNQILKFLASLPERIFAIFTKIGPLIASALQSAVDFGHDIVVNGFNAIIDFVMSVPDRIKDLIPTFGNAGKNLIQSFMNGFRSVGNFIGDVAGDIVGAVKGFLNKAIDKINVGIAKVDEFLPGDLGRIPRLADGAFVPRRPGGILANVGEGNEDEWVLPQSKLDAMLNGGNVTFGPNSINVNFSGVVPTAEEAQQTGEAIGQGIISLLQRRNARANVRAI